MKPLYKAGQLLLLYRAATVREGSRQVLHAYHVPVIITRAARGWYTFMRVTGEPMHSIRYDDFERDASVLKRLGHIWYRGDWLDEREVANSGLLAVHGVPWWPVKADYEDAREFAADAMEFALNRTGGGL